MASVCPNVKDGKIISYKIKVFLGRDDNGKQIFRCKTWAPNKPMSETRARQMAEKEAVIWEKQMCEQFEREQETPKQIVLSDFVHREWLPNQMNEKDRRTSTVAFHTYMLDTILPQLGNYPLRELTPSVLESFFDYLKNTYCTKKGQPLSPKTLRHHYCTLHLVLAYAVKREYLEINPLNKIEKPREEKHKVDALSKGEVLSFIKEIEKLPLKQHLMYMLLLTTGIRRGECFGLQWDDVDENNAVLHVKRNVTYTARGGIQVGLPKTEMGLRTIPLTKKVLDLIRQYKAEENTVCKLSKDAFLFHSAKTVYEPQDPTYITKHMRRFMSRIGLPHMSPHDLRHTCASLLLQSGADIKSVQDILGHADASTTLNFYARSNIETMRASTQKAFDL